MKITVGRFGYVIRQLSIILYASFLVFIVALVFSKNTLANMKEQAEMCADMNDKDKRLECYDKLFGKTEPVHTNAEATNEQKKKETKECKSKKYSMMDKLWDLDDGCRKNAPLVNWHNPNYFLFAAYDTSPNRDVLLDDDPTAKAQNTEAVFQISGKVRPYREHLLGNSLDFWLGYTQLSFWQVYNTAFSSPFRDTNYAPEGFFTYHRLKDESSDPALMNLRIINAGFVHQSNGRSEPLSRSWNRLFTEFGFERIFDGPENKRHELNLFVKAWYRLPENAEDDDNPDIEKYMGHGEIRGVYYGKDCRFGMMLRNNLRTENKGAIQLDLSLPFSIFNHEIGEKMSFYVQYFNGYGESLLDYNSNSNRISAGVMLTDWGM